MMSPAGDVMLSAGMFFLLAARSLPPKPQIHVSKKLQAMSFRSSIKGTAEFTEDWHLTVNATPSPGGRWRRKEWDQTDRQRRMREKGEGNKNRGTHIHMPAVE
jgi:hypothetical protein